MSTSASHGPYTRTLKSWLLVTDKKTEREVKRDFPRSHSKVMAELEIKFRSFHLYCLIFSIIPPSRLEKK